MKTLSGTEIPKPTIPSLEELERLDSDNSFKVGVEVREYLLEVLVGQPDMYPVQLAQLPQSVRSCIQNAQEKYEAALIRGEYDSATRFAFWLEKLAHEFQKKGFPVALNPREKAALARNREGAKTLKSYCLDLFDILWDVPLREKIISSDAVIMLEEILPGAFRYLQLRGVQFQDNSNTSDGVF